MAGDTCQNQEANFKILVLGDSSVGKTSLINMYVDGKFVNNQSFTVGMDCHHKVLLKDGWKLKLKIWDTAGQERFRTLTTAYYRGAHGIMLVYDITNEDTFRNLGYWLENLQRMAPDVLAKVIVGNKVDLDSKRAVPKERAQRLATSFGVDFFETSNKASINVDDAFQQLTSNVLRGLMEQKNRKPSRELERPKSLMLNSASGKRKKKCAC